MGRVSLGKMLLLPNGCVLVTAKEQTALGVCRQQGLQSRNENNREFPWESRD